MNKRCIKCFLYMVPGSQYREIFFLYDWRSESLAWLRERRHLHFYRSPTLRAIQLLNVRFLSLSTTDSLDLAVLRIVGPLPTGCQRAPSFHPSLYPTVAPIKMVLRRCLVSLWEGNHLWLRTMTSVSPSALVLPPPPSFFLSLTLFPGLESQTWISF